MEIGNFSWHVNTKRKVSSIIEVSIIAEGNKAACILAIAKENISLEEKVILNTSGLERFNSQAVQEYKDFFEKNNLPIHFQKIVSNLLTRGIWLNTLRTLHSIKEFNNIFWFQKEISDTDCIKLDIARFKF